MRLAVLAVAAVLMAPLSANALLLQPGDEILSGNQTSQNEIDSAIAASLGTSVELYKSNVGGADEGSFAGDYQTTFSNTSQDPSDALIEWVGPDVITNATHLLVKDGNQTPAWYLFSILGWNGLDDIQLLGFWPNQGAISHVAIYGGGDTVTVPEPGTLLLLGLGLVGLAATRRRKLVA
jgi:hypothetical protein